MKKITCIILLTVFGACSEDFLERPPLAQLSAGNYPNTGAEAVSATNAIYNTLRAWHFNTGGFPLLDIMSDDAVKGSTPGDAIQISSFEDFSYTPFAGSIENWYRTLYQGIRRAHLVLENLPEIDMNNDLKERLEGEARFLRAYFYSLLVRGFGDVPLVTSSEPPANITKSSSEEIFSQVIFPDLQYALEHLPEKSEYAAENIGRVTKGATRALLARLHLYRNDFESAARYALEVINSQEYDLEEDFSDAFDVAHEHGVESIFEVGALPEQGVGRGGNQFGNTQGVRGTPNWGWGFNRPSFDWLTFMDSEDPRYDASVIFLGETINDVTIRGDASTPDTIYTDNTRTEIREIEAYNQKIVTEGGTGSDQWGHNRRLIRYADVLLMAAEALNEIGNPEQALVYLNEVRERARGDDEGVLPDITTTDQDELRQIIYEERRRELFLEGLRFWDLVRTDRAVEVLGPLGFVEGKHEFFPIPQAEVDISEGRITQNENWN